jgi:TolA-binding protein
MKVYLNSRSILPLIFFFILLALSSYLRAATQPSISVSNKIPMKKIISITTEQNKSGTIVNVLANGIIPDYTTKSIDFPPRIVVDIFYAADPLESMTIPAKTSLLKSIRVGYHQKRIRLVLDIKGADIPLFRTKSVGNKLTIFLRAQRFVKGKSDQIRCRQANKGFPALEQLIKIEVDDGKNDTAFFLKGVNAYRSKNWSEAIENCNHLIKTYPTGRYAERAYFLRAQSYEQLYSSSIVDHFTEIKRYYENAVNRFPESIYVPGAFLAIGNLCFNSKNYYEALAYYNLIFKKYKGSITSLRALMQKVKILLLKKKRKEALSILEYVVYQYPGLPEETEAKIEMSKILYEMNRFHRSIKILSDVREIHSKTMYQYPEVLLYLGYNYYELEDYKMARENLFSFYNHCSDRKMNHMILTKIGDTYRDEGLMDDAVKIYQLVFELYPDTEGAIISLIRFAEQQEKGGLEIERGISSPVKIINKEIGLPKEIYEDIMNNLLKKDEKNPLAQLALLKLAVLYQREKNYEKSLDALKELLNKYPRTSLKKECKYALNKTLRAILNEEMKKGRYKNIINIYHRERNLFSMINSPDPFLIIARVSKRLKLHDMATEMYIRADSLLPDNRKPADLLFYVSSDLFRKKDELAGAFLRLDLLINHYPTDKNIPHAYKLKGQILLKQKKYPQAVEMFSSALRYHLKRCERTAVLIEKAKALIRINLNEEAFAVIREADKLKRNCYINYPYMYHEIGDLYLHAGYPKNAILVFNDVLEMEKKEENKIKLKLKIAQCYQLLNKKKDYLSLYNEISNLNDPFWSNMAKEKIDEINFAREMRETKKE